MLLAVDLGNTTLGYAFFDGDTCMGRGVLLVGEVGDTDRLNRMRGEGEAPEEIAISSVNPGVLSELVGRIRKEWGRTPFVFREDFPPSIEILYENPREVGSDRLLNAIAAHRRYDGSTIVIDFGTAITFDLVSPEGAYLGGLILPGMALSAFSLWSRTALLPQVTVGRPGEGYGTNTRDAIRRGIYWGTVGAVDRVASTLRRSLEKRYGNPVHVVATGGDASLVWGDLPVIQGLDPLLTLEGLRIAYEEWRGAGREA